ncbi:urotensin 2, alpha [Misgurnus anguillicaudatus]|uniref:urotensin 2, alpha n=1 Tax=Misgurnus anguillicaudatus TaxID=75329 RepID=UPI003CCF2F81
MFCNLMLACSVLLLSCSHLLAHPVTNTAEMTYSSPDSVEDAGVGTDDFIDLLQRAAVGHSPLLTRDSFKMSGQIPLKEVLVEKPYRLMPAGSLWSSRRQFRKRGSAADCFWKYCV